MEQQIDYNYQAFMVTNDCNYGLDYFNSFPTGYRFCPTDEELAVHYLTPKVLKQSLPRNMIPEVNLYGFDPETLTEKYKKCGEDYWYFFTSRDKKYPKGKRPRRSAGDGFWKATGSYTKITKEENGEILILGLRRSLVYYKGNNSESVKTNWIMHEFCVPKDVQQAITRQPNVDSMLLDEWVLCRMYNKIVDKNDSTGTNNSETQTPSAITSPPDVVQSETPVVVEVPQAGSQLEAPEITLAPVPAPVVEDGSYGNNSDCKKLKDAFMDLANFLSTTRGLETLNYVPDDQSSPQNQQ